MHWIGNLLLSPIDIIGILPSLHTILSYHEIVLPPSASGHCVCGRIILCQCVSGIIVTYATIIDVLHFYFHCSVRVHPHRIHQGIMGQIQKDRDREEQKDT